MKKKSCLVAVLLLAVLAAASSTVLAAPVLVTFQSSAIVATATDHAGWTIAPGDGKLGIANNVVRTYGDSPDAQAFNLTLSSWGAGKGISEFNLWLQDGTTTQAAMWSENLSIADWTSISAAAPFGWSTKITDAPTSWGFPDGHKLIAFYTTDSNFFLRPGQSDMTFSFTADLSETIVPSIAYQIWIGAGYALGTGPGDTNFSNTGGLVGTGTDGFQRSVPVGVEPVPEPATLTLLGLGLAGIARAARRRKK